MDSLIMKKKSQLDGHRIEWRGEVVFTLTGDIDNDISLVRPASEHAFSIVTDIFILYQAVTDEPERVLSYYRKCILLINTMRPTAAETFSRISLKYLIPRIKAGQLPFQDNNVKILVRSLVRNIDSMETIGEFVFDTEKHRELNSLIRSPHEVEIAAGGNRYKFDLFDINRTLAGVKNKDLALPLIANIFYSYLESTTDSKEISFYFERSIKRLLALVPEKKRQIDGFGLGVFDVLCRKIINHELWLDQTMTELLKKAPGNYEAIGDDLAYWELYRFLKERNRQDLIRLLNSK